MSAKKKITSAQTVHNAIAERILNGEFRPGEKLDEAGLAGQFQVSRTPVREALRQLVATGLVEHRPNRGVIVSLPSDAQLAEMFELLAELEGSCAKYAALRMSPSEKAELAQVHQRAAHMVAMGDDGGYRSANRSFHAAIYAGSHNALLIQTTELTHARCAPFREAQFRIPERLEKSLIEHSAVVDAIMIGDAVRAHHAMFTHMSVVRVASSGYVHELEQGQPPAPEPKMPAWQSEMHQVVKPTTRRKVKSPI